MVRARGATNKVVAQSVLLYSINIWVVTGEMLKVLERFHHQAAQRIKGLMKELYQAKINSTPW